MVLVAAAGSGARLGRGAPKALCTLGGEALLVHALRRVVAATGVAAVVVAVPAQSVAEVAGLLAPVAPAVPLTVVAGGVTRQASVSAALAASPADLDIVLVHDAARALAPVDLIERVAAAVRAGHDAVIPVLPVVDTVKQIDSAGAVVATVDRSLLRAVQTPQGFRRAVLIAAHAGAVDDLTDDAGLVEKAGFEVWTVPGAAAAMKITEPFDLQVAELLLHRGGNIAG